jgi:hypothetical protein
MATSTVPTLKANLQTQLAARGGLSGVQISYGPPLPALQKETIWLGDADGTQDNATFQAPNQVLEQYDLQIVTNVIREGTDEVAADNRCFAIQAELENQLRGDPTVNGAVANAEIARFRLSENLTPDGMTRTARLVTLVHCEAWI